MTGENKENGVNLDNLDDILSILKEAQEEHESKNEGFRNQFHFNDTCFLITIIFLFAFIYKKELMKCLK